MNEEKKAKILKFAQLSIKEARAEGDFDSADKSEMQQIQIDLGMTKSEILAEATSLLCQ